MTTPRTHRSLSRATRQRPRGVAWCVLVGAGLVAEGCGALHEREPASMARGAPETRASEAEATRSAPAAERAEGPSSEVLEPEPAPTPREPPPPLTLEVREERGAIVVAITNDTDALVPFASRLRVEVDEEARGWRAIDEEPPLVVELTPGHPLPDCASLAPGATLERALPDALGAGPVRVVVTSCDGGARVESAPLTPR